jgi:hypothetical protein
MSQQFDFSNRINWPNWLQEAVDRWPSTVIAREQTGTFTGGLVNPRTVANHDSLGIGPKEPIAIGRRRGYTVVSFAEYIAARCGGAEVASHAE